MSKIYPILSYFPVGLYNPRIIKEAFRAMLSLKGERAILIA
jgi:hypothetical protein